jgi:hypothetical protein
MYSTKELGNISVVSAELEAAFPILTAEEIASAIALALMWRRVLDRSGWPVH